MTIDTDLATLREGLFHATREKSALERSPVPGTPIGEAHLALDRVEAELARLRWHAGGEIPTRERIRDYHSRLPADWQGWDAVREDHFAYYQGPDACYICTLLAALEAAERELARLREGLRDAAVVIEKMANGTSRAEVDPEFSRFRALLADTPDHAPPDPR